MFFKTLNEWLNWLESLPPKISRLSLEQLKSIAKELLIWPIPVPVITVTGTNGKGSCVALLAACLTAAGNRVATYTSPHLLKYNERICCNNIPVSDAILCEAFAAIEQVRKDVVLNYFEFTTLAALYIFKQTALDVWILEVGVGGRLDPVNIIDADLAIISTVAIDHIAWLGATRELIGREKAGIMRAHKPIICGDFNTPHCIIEYAKEVEASLYLQGTDFGFTQKKSTWTWWSKAFGEFNNLPLPQVELQNAATVLAALACLSQSLFKNKFLQNSTEQHHQRYLVSAPNHKQNDDNSTHSSDRFAEKVLRPQKEKAFATDTFETELHSQEEKTFSKATLETAQTSHVGKTFTKETLLKHCFSTDVKTAFYQALNQTHLPGRIQKLSGTVIQILDVAHNPAAAELLSKRLKNENCTGRRFAVLAMLADKDLLGTVTPLLPLINVWHVGAIQTTRGGSADELARILRLHGASFVYTYASVSSAYSAALADACSGDLIVVFGSFYTVAEVLETL